MRRRVVDVDGLTAQKIKGNAVDRLKRRIEARIDADKDKPRALRKSQQGLAKEIGIKKSTLSELISGASSQRGLLAHLDKIAHYFGVPPSLLVHANDTSLIELERNEWRVLQHWRTFPDNVQESILELFDYFAGLLPEEKEHRRILTKWAKLTADERAHLEQVLNDVWRERRFRRARGSGGAGPPSSDETPKPSDPQE